MTAPAIDHSLQLPPTQYFPQGDPKSLIVLHHTVGGSARSTLKWWNDTAERIGTAYIVERDGTVYEVFPPEGWAWHIGVGDAALEKRSIGIELASEGALAVRQDGEGEWWAFGANARLGKVIPLQQAGRILKLSQSWRGFRWFDAYEPAQVAATVALVVSLCDRFGIPRTMPTPAECRGNADLERWRSFRGVLHHALLRHDKSDLHPVFDFERLAAALQGA